MAQQPSSGNFYEKMASYPLMTPERRQELLERFYATQLEIINGLVGYMVPLYRYFAKELEARNTELENDDTAEQGSATRVSRLKGNQLKQIAKMLMELKEAHERKDEAMVTLLREQFHEMALGFDYALLSTLASPANTDPIQEFILTEKEAADVVAHLRELTARADEDRDALFKGNWRLVMEIGRRFQAFGSKLDLDEMIQEGNTGLLAAIDKFNPKLNNQLSTLAANWIQAKIRRALDNLSETIRTPVYKRQRKKQVQKAELELLMQAQAEEGKKEKTQGLMTGAEKLFGRSVDDKSIADKVGLSVEEVQELRRLYPETISIHATVDGSDDDGSMERGDTIADTSHVDEQPNQDQADKNLFFTLLTGLVDDLPLPHQVVLGGLNGLPIRKQSLKQLVSERMALVRQRGESLMRGSAQMTGKATIQVFK